MVFQKLFGQPLAFHNGLAISFLFVSMLKSILIIVQIISIPLLTDRALKSGKLCNIEKLFFALFVSNARNIVW